MKIIVDADGCPRSVLEICHKVGQEEEIEVWTVASFNHDIRSEHHIVVGDSPQEADIKVINITDPGDVVVTQDWGLAAMVLGKAAACISPDGREYLPGKIDFLLEEREIKAKIRRAGGRTRGPRKRTAGDDLRFEQGLRKLIKRMASSR